MTYSQNDRLGRIQHTLLPTTEKKFYRKWMKNDGIRAFFEPQILIDQPQYLEIVPNPVTSIVAKKSKFFLAKNDLFSLF